MDAPARFEAHIKPDGGRALVISSAMIGGACVLAGLMLSQPLLVLAALIAFAVSLYNYPLLGAREAQLSAGLDGLELDGLGTIGWRSIQSLELGPAEGPASLHCHLADTLEQAIKSQGETSALRTVQVNIWRLQDEKTLVIDLSRFVEEPQDVLYGMTLFHERATL
jgi:hypothetical protein